MKKLPYKPRLRVIGFIFYCVICFYSGLYISDYIETKRTLSVLENKPLTKEKRLPNKVPISTKDKKIITLSKEETINIHVKEVCKKYNMEPEFIESIIYHESRYNPKATNGDCVGLMQISKRWHKERAKKLGVTNFYDPYSNILLGTDYLSELFKIHKDPNLVLMVYNMNNNRALALYKDGKVSYYARSVLTRYVELKQGVK